MRHIGNSPLMFIFYNRKNKCLIENYFSVLNYLKQRDNNLVTLKTLNTQNYSEETIITYMVLMF